jgi:hypothetical protein
LVYGHRRIADHVVVTCVVLNGMVCFDLKDLRQRRCLMNWLKDFFFCNTWREFFVMSVLASMGAIVIWALLFLTIILFG